MPLARTLLRTVFRQPQAYLGLFCNIMVIVALTFAQGLIFSVVLPVLPQSSRESNGSFTLLLVIALIALLYSVRILYQERQKYFGLLLLLGITRWQLQWMIGIETLVVGLVSIGSGLVGGIFLSWFLLRLTRRLLQLPDLPYYFSFAVFQRTAAAFLLIFLLIGLLAPLFVRSRRILALLKNAQTPQVYPSSSPWLGLISLFSFVWIAFICYGSDVKLQPDQMVLSSATKFLLSLGLALVGTYCFYLQGSVALAKKLRSSRSFAWRGHRILWLSSLAHRLRDNARLFSVMTVTMMFSLGAAGTAITFHSTLDYFFSQNRLLPFQLLYFEYPPQGEEASGRTHQELEQQLAASFGATPWRLDAMVLAASSTDARKFNEAWVLPANQPGSKAPGAPLELPQVGPEELVSLQVCRSEECRRDPALLPSLAGRRADRVLQYSDLQPFPYFELQDHRGRFAKEFWIAGATVAQDLAKAGQKKEPNEAGFLREKVSAYAFTVPPAHVAQISGDLQRKFGKEQLRFPHEELKLKSQPNIRLMAFSLLSVVILCLGLILLCNNALILRAATEMQGQRRKHQNLLHLGVPLAAIRRAVTIQIAIFSWLPLLVAASLASCALAYLHRLLRGIAAAPWSNTEIDISTSLPAMNATAGCVFFCELLFFFWTRHQILRSLADEKP